MYDGKQNTATFRTPWHVEVMGRPLPYDGDHTIDDVVRPVLPETDSRWPITRELGLLLGRLIADHGRRAVLEFGAGSSSLVTATVLSNRGGGRLTSLEQDVSWCNGIWSQVTAVDGGFDGELVAVEPHLRFSRIGLHHQFDVADVLSRRGPFDMVLIDAPQYWLGRAGALPTVAPHLSDGALIVLDDAARKGERWALYRWLRSYPGLELVAYDQSFGGRGVAVLRWTRDAGSRLSPLGWVSSVTDRVYSVTRRALVRVGILPATN